MRVEIGTAERASGGEGRDPCAAVGAVTGMFHWVIVAAMRTTSLRR